VADLLRKCEPSIGTGVIVIPAKTQNPGNDQADLHAVHRPPARRWRRGASPVSGENRIHAYEEGHGQVRSFRPSPIATQL
jgi:hypothetical protein